MTPVLESRNRTSEMMADLAGSFCHCHAVSAPNSAYRHTAHTARRTCCHFGEMLRWKQNSFRHAASTISVHSRITMMPITCVTGEGRPSCVAEKVMKKYTLRAHRGMTHTHQTSVRLAQSRMCVQCAMPGSGPVRLPMRVS